MKSRFDPDSSPRPVLILHEALGAAARADEVDALVQVREVSAAMERLGIEPVAEAIGLDLGAAMEAVRRHDPCCVFNLVESLGGCGKLIGVLPTLLETGSVPFTGSGGDALQLTSHKTVAKRLMAMSGIATPDWLAADGERGDGPHRWIVKSIWEHASFGIDDSSVVRGRNAAIKVLQQRARDLGGEWFAERYIDGREFNVSLLEHDGRPRVLPLAEMTFRGFAAGKPKIVGYAAKWDESAAEYHATKRVYPRLDRMLRSALEDVALRCWDLFGLRGYARVDLRLDDEDLPWVLEINANPCLSSDAGFAAAGAKAGLSYDQVVERILNAALPRKRDELKRVG